MKYLIIGSGRLARHIEYYFLQLKLPVSVWSRSADPQALHLKNALIESSHILLAVSDQSLSEVELIVQDLLQEKLSEKCLVHFSGASQLKLAIAAHPLMSFGSNLFSLQDYVKIHFTIFDEQKRLSEILPGLPNPSTNLDSRHQAFYHSLCVMGGNFPILLWQKMRAEFKSLNLPDSSIEPYLQKILENFLQDPDKALTGPLVRNDQLTIQKNLKALTDDPYKKVYEAFCSAYKDSSKIGDPSC